MKGVRRQEFTSGRVEIVLARPDRKNALDAEAVVALARAVEASQQATLVMVRGEGDSFCSGGDLESLHRLPAEQLQATLALTRATVARLGQLPAVVVAWVEGVALGGGLELALAADLIWMAPGARLRAAQLEMGLVPTWGGMAAARRRLGEARARALYLDPCWISAEQALTAHLADRQLADLRTARAEADRLLGFSHRAMAAIKGGRDAEAGLFARLWDDEAHRQAVARFRARASRPDGSPKPRRQPDQTGGTGTG